MILTEKDLELLNAIRTSPVPENERNSDLKIEFDGTTVLCRVCGDKASGFHYGVHSCEGCKGFFRRSIQQKIQYRPCTKNQQCSILRINRNRCQYCRLKKCIAVGMSRDAVRFGRVPKREKAKILAAMQKVNASSQEKALGVELEDELKLMSTIVRAHEETCDYTKDKVQILIEKSREHPVYAQCPPQLSCPLNSAPHITEDGASHYMEDFSERFTPAIQGVVEYAKRIPGFSFLSQDDQLTLLKAGVFEVLLVRLACMFDSQASILISLNGQVLRRESIHSASNARFLLDSMFDFAERMNGLRLTDSEVGLFSAVVVIAADRPGLRNTDLVLKIQKKLMDVLQKTVMGNHTENPNIFGDLMKKIPDLRTLNTLHSEKLLAYKMEPRNQTANGQTVEVPNGVPNSCPVVFNPNMYATIPQEIWSQYSLVATQQCLTIEEGQRSTSPGQHSQHSGTSTGSEWSTTDSKDEHDLMGSPRSVGSGLCVEDAKSPVRTSSFSSSRSFNTEDIWPAEIGPQTADYHNKRLRESNGSEHGSSSGDEGYFVDSPVKGTVIYPKLRRVDSPTDSGIESGKEHSGPSTTPTISICSSPRSTVDEKVKDVVEDMPVLKRALQAPPLVNTNMLMDEAYRHHKKFRAARRDADSPSSPSSISLASTHSTLVRTLEQAPRYLSEQQLKRTDLIHNIIMRTETIPGQQPQVTSPPLPHHQNHQTSHSLLHELSPQQHQQLLQQSNNGTTVGIQLTINGQYPFNTSVPNHSPVPPNFVSSPQQQQQQPQQQKNLLLCPSGYYIPHRNSSSPIYSTTPTSWQLGQSPHTTSTMSATSGSSSPIHIHTQFAAGTNEHEQTHPSQPAPQNNNSNLCPVNHLEQRSSAGVVQSLSPRLVYSSRASPVAPGSPLVINGLPPVATASSPLPPVCQLESSRISSPVQQRQHESADSQPLNLSKKLFSPPMLKMES